MTDTINNAPLHISDSEYTQFRAWQDNNIRKSALAEGRTLASAERLADDQAADSGALAKLTSRGLTLRDAFGASSTKPGRDLLANIYRSGIGSKSGVYARLRRLASTQGLVN